MQRSQQVFRKPTSSKVYQSSMQGFYPIQSNEARRSSYTKYFDETKNGGIPFNQISSINFSTSPIENATNFNSTLKRNSYQKPLPHKTKVYFSYNPRTSTVERHYIQTIIRETEKPFSNQWEQRYFELYKQINGLLMHNQKLSEQFLKIREELKTSNEAAIQNSIENFTRTQSFMENNNRQEKNELRENYQRIKTSLQKSQHEASLFKEQNIRRQNMIEKLQSELLSEKNLTFKIEMEKNQILNQNIKIQYELKEMLAEKVKMEAQIYELKMALANKNIQLEQFSADRQNVRRVEDRNKSPEKMTQEKFEEKLTRLRTEYEKKEKKMEKLVQAKQKQNSDLRKFITEVEEKQRAARQLKQNYEKLYNEKKAEVINLKKVQQSLLSSQEDDRQIVFYEQRINQLNKLAGEQAQKIKQLEKAKVEMNKRIDQYQDNYVTQEHLNYLHEVVETKQNKILEQGGINYDTLNNKAHSYFNGKVFEEKMIYQLKKDNQKLMELVRNINFKDFVTQPQVIFNQNVVINNQSSGTSMEMQKMISDIFFKLDRVTEGMRYQSNRSSQMLPSNEISPKQKKSKQSPRSPRKDKRKSDDQSQHRSKSGKVYHQISHELDTLKVYIVNLSATCDRLVRQLENEQQSRMYKQKQQKQSLRKEIKINQMVPKDEEILSFYKQKNKQLQGRVNELLNLCSSLKQKMCERRIQENSGGDYWKNQVKASKEALQDLKLRYQKLLQKLEASEDLKEQFESKVALFSLEIERLTQQIRENQQKLATIGIYQKQIEHAKLQKSNAVRDLSISEHRIQELNGKLQEYQSLLRMKENESSNLLSKCNQANSSTHNLQLVLKDKQNKLQTSIRANQNLQSSLEQLRRKCQNSETNLVRLQQQLQKATSELESYRKSSLQNQSETNEWKSRVFQISHQLQSERRQIATLTTQISTSHSHIQEWGRKYTLLEKQHQRIVAELQNQLRSNSLLKEKLKTNIVISNLSLSGFSLQKLRSRVIETQVLINQLSLQSSNRNKQIVNVLGRNFTEILDFFSEISTQNINGSKSSTQREYMQKIHNLEQKIRENTQTGQYKLEFLRSLLLEFECLIKEIKIGDQRDRQIVDTLSNEIKKGFDSLSTFEVF